MLPQQSSPSLARKNKPVPKSKVALTWFLMLAVFGAMFVGITWFFQRDAAPPPQNDSVPTIFRSVFLLIVGGFFLMAGIVAYAGTILTNCFTFNFKRPIYKELKVKIYFANIFVPLGWGLGFGFIIAAFVSPVLLMRGMDTALANILPVMGTIFFLQIAQMWFVIWAPLEKRLITKRLQALGITTQQLCGAFLVGISNPARSSFKKFGAVEDDVGGLWVGPDQLIYWGDAEQFAISREQILHIEQKADSGGTSMLGGIAHVILHVRMPDDTERQIRLHMEGCWTLGLKKKAMDQLAEAVLQWQTNAVASTTP
jgi:hypothetical protein